MSGRLIGGAAVAAGIGLAALVTVSARRPQSKPPTTGRIVDVDGVEVFVEDRGKGDAIVLIHGFGGSTFTFRHLMEPLAQEHRVVSLDLPGFGWSDRNPEVDMGHDAQADRVARLLQLLDISSALVVGHSMGGGVAQRLAVRHPEAVRGLVLLSSVDAGDGERWRRGQRRATPLLRLIALGSRLTPWLFHASLRRGLRSMVADPSVVDDAMVAGYAAPLARPGTTECLDAMFRAVLDQDPCPVSEIRCPVLVISGDRDTVIKHEVGLKLAKDIPGARLVEVSGMGHLGADELPERLIREIRDFVTTLDAVPA